MTSSVASVPLPDVLARSPLLRDGAFAVFDEIPGPAVVRTLRIEALAAFSSASLTDIRSNDDEEVRGGNPARRFASATGGPHQSGFYHSRETSRFLDVAHSGGAVGASFWSWQEISQEQWTTMSQFAWPVTEPPGGRS